MVLGDMPLVDIKISLSLLAPNLLLPPHPSPDKIYKAWRFHKLLQPWSDNTCIRSKGPQLKLRNWRWNL